MHTLVGSDPCGKAIVAQRLPSTSMTSIRSPAVNATQACPDGSTTMPSGQPLSNVCTRRGCDQAPDPGAATSYASSSDDRVAVTNSEQPSWLKPRPLMNTGPFSTISCGSDP